MISMINVDEIVTREQAKTRISHYADALNALRDDVLIGITSHKDNGRCEGFTITFIRNPYAPPMGVNEAVRDEVHAFAEQQEHALSKLTGCVADAEQTSYLASANAPS